jgi:hypothetical protein
MAAAEAVDQVHEGAASTGTTNMVGGGVDLGVLVAEVDAVGGGGLDQDRRLQQVAQPDQGTNSAASAGLQFSCSSQWAGVAMLAVVRPTCR